MVNLLADSAVIDTTKSAIDFSTIDTTVVVATIVAGVAFGFGLKMLVVPAKKGYALIMRAIKGM